MISGKSENIRNFTQYLLKLFVEKSIKSNKNEICTVSINKIAVLDLLMLTVVLLFF